MKAILFVALFALAAAQFNSDAYHQGFVDQLNLTSTQLADANACHTAIQTTIADIQNVFVAKNQGIQQLLFALMALVSEAQTQLQTECQAYAMDLALYFSQNANGTDPRQLAAMNFNQYGAEVVQQIALYIQDLVNGNDYQAGQTEAYIFQILFGYEKPQVPQMPQINWTNNVQFNVTEYISQYYEGVLPGIGVNNTADMDTVINCALEMTNTFQGLGQTAQNWTQSDLQGKISIVKNAFDQVMGTAELCVPAFEIEFEAAAPYWRAFFANPIHYIFTLVSNVALNAPQLEQLEMNQFAETYNGQYFQAGQTYAQIFSILTQGITNY